MSNSTAVQADLMQKIANCTNKHFEQSYDIWYLYLHYKQLNNDRFTKFQVYNLIARIVSVFIVKLLPNKVKNRTQCYSKNRNILKRLKNLKINLVLWIAK